jgi:hypothetical protein
MSLLVGYCTVRLVFVEILSFTTLRDAVPYLYGFVAFLAAGSYRVSTPEQRLTAVRWIRWALLFHLAWVAFARFNPALNTQEVVTGDVGLTVFRIRTDLDTTILGITAAWFLLRLLRGDTRQAAWLVVLSCYGLVLSLNSRAGLLATILCTLLALACFLAAPGQPRRRLAVIAIAPLAAALVVAALPTTTAGAKLAGGLGIPVAGADPRLGVGTQEARAKSWSYVVEYTAQDPLRSMVGVGFGENFLA